MDGEGFGSVDGICLFSYASIGMTKCRISGGAIVGAGLTTGVGLGLGVPYLGAAIKVVGTGYLGGMAIGTVSGVVGGLAQGIATGDWSKLGNAAKIFAGNFYLDSKRGFLGQLSQGATRFTSEFLQNMIGHGYTQVRNAVGRVDRVDYFGGATFSTNEFISGSDDYGVSIGNFINMSITDEITGNFADYVVESPLFMHEYGHTFDSKRLGLKYLFKVGILRFKRGTRR